MHKKIWKWLLSLSFVLSVAGCQKETPPPDQPFDEFISTVEAAMLEGTTAFNMNFLINDPEALGLEKATTYGIGFASKEDYDQMYQEYSVFLDQLERYDTTSFTNVQKRTYDALSDYLSRELALQDYYYYDNDVIGSYSSIVQELPLLLQMYAFNDQDDLESYFQDIAQFKEDFLNYVAFEKERQSLGLGYSQDILDDTKKQILDIIASGGEEIISEVNATIDQLTFLNEDEKRAYQDRNRITIQNDLMGAYQALYDALDQIEGAAETKGLYSVKNGKKYYEAIVYNQLGIKDSISDIEDHLEDVFTKNLARLQAFILTHSYLLNKTDIYDIQYSEFDTPEEGLDYLKTKIFSVVPEISELSYRVYTVPESLQEGFAPAAYLTARIDMREDQSEVIMINPTSTENILPTLVHEGYPGHMYQHSYFQSLDFPTINSMLDCIGYTEGWAIYMESMASRYIEDQDEQDWQTLIQYDNDVSTPLLALMDIGIHYHGWDYEDCKNYFKKMIGSDVGDGLKNLYDIIVQTPGYYLYYIYSGQILLDLYEQAQDELGSSFDEISFNQCILDSGPIGLDVVRRNVNQYIQENR